MEPTASKPRDDSERTPAQGFQSEGGEHARFAPPAEAAPVASEPATAYQREDDGLVLTID